MSWGRSLAEYDYCIQLPVYVCVCVCRNKRVEAESPKKGACNIM